MGKECVLVSASELAQGRTGISYMAGISAATTQAEGLCLQLASLPPGRRSRAHQHDEHESAAYMLEGEMVMWFGDRLETRLVARPGDFVYIPKGVPHVVLNESDTTHAIAVLARTDPNEQEVITELPELDALELVAAEA